MQRKKVYHNRHKRRTLYAEAERQAMAGLQELLRLERHLAWIEQTGNYESLEQTGKAIERVGKRYAQIEAMADSQGMFTLYKSLNQK